MRSVLTLAAALSTSFWLVACGDSPSSMSETRPANATEVPASATADTAAYVSFAGSLPANETQEPLGVGKAAPPTSETSEPSPI
jgi:hypothetical protein